MKLPITCADIALPVCEDMTKWAVVACDQFTSNPAYWETLKGFVGGAPSALNLIFPECYLSADNSRRIADIENSMKDYISRGVFRTVNGMILTERNTVYGKRRRGIVAAFDLEDYSFVPADHALIRATEGTIVDRIPPRVEIRSHCALEFPHIMLLIDDKADGVFSCVEKGECLYDFDLNMRGGHVKGNLIKNPDAVLERLEGLLADSKEKYGESLLFAVGDGNHSLATAKAIWQAEKQKDSPNPAARYALAEFVNIYDEGICFEPIHRLVKNVDAEHFISRLGKAFADGERESRVYYKGGRQRVLMPAGAVDAVKRTQDFIDAYLAAHGGEADYIHGLAELEHSAEKPDCAGIALFPMDKAELFPYVVACGALPRKTFSMGEAEEKRYYIEGRRIK